MSVLSQRALVGSILGLVMVSIYTIWAIQHNLVTSHEWREVALALIIFIGISIVVMIIAMIVLHIVIAASAAHRTGKKEEAEREMASIMVEDERERLITLKSERASAIGAGMGFIAMLILLACGVAPGLALHVMLWACVVNSGVEAILVVFFSEGGVSHA